MNMQEKLIPIKIFIIRVLTLSVKRLLTPLKMHGLRLVWIHYNYYSKSILGGRILELTQIGPRHIIYEDVGLMKKVR